MSLLMMLRFRQVMHCQNTEYVIFVGLLCLHYLSLQKLARASLCLTVVCRVGYRQNQMNRHIKNNSKTSSIFRFVWFGLECKTDLAQQIDSMCLEMFLMLYVIHIFTPLRWYGNFYQCSVDYYYMARPCNFNTSRSRKVRTLICST